MNTRFLVTGTLVAAIAVFVWQSISNAALTWHMPNTFANDSAVIAAIKANAPANGVYAADQGIYATVAFRDDMASHDTFMGSMLAKQFVADVVLCFALALVFLALVPASTTSTVKTFALVGLAAGLLTPISNSIWYGYPFMEGIKDTIDLMINCVLAGVVLAALHKRYAAASSAPGSGVRAEGGLRPSDPSRSTSKV